MKKFIFFLIAVLFTFGLKAQSTDAALTTQANVIRNETNAGANTKTRIANMFQGLIDSKVSLLGSYANPSWITSLAWSKITSTPTTLAGYGITDAQAIDADLTAIAALSSTGILVRTGSNTFVLRTATGTTNRLTVTNGDGVSGNPTFDLSATLEASFGKVANPLSQFASTTSAQLAGVLSDELGTGTVVFSSTLSSYQPIDSDLTAIAALTPSNDDFIQRKAGVWTNRTIAQVKTDLGVVSLTDGSGLTFDTDHFDLGGTITRDTDIEGAGYSLNLGLTGSRFLGINIFAGTNGFNIISSGGSSALAVDNGVTNQYLLISGSQTNLETIGFGLIGNSSTALFTDNRSTKRGLQYAADYSANYTTRSIPDRAYVDTKQPLNSNLTTIAGLSPSNDDILQRKSGAWTNRTLAQYRTDLALVVDAINDGVTTTAPSQNAVFDALALKQPLDAGLTAFATLDIVANAGKKLEWDGSGTPVAVAQLTNPCSTPGCLAMWDVASFTNLDPGTEGYVLTIVSGVPAYAVSSAASSGTSNEVQFTDNAGGFVNNGIASGGTGKLWFIDTGVAALQMESTGNILTLGRNLTLSGSDNNVGAGYKLIINGGDALSGNNNGGNIELNAGSKSGSGTPGIIKLNTGSATTIGYVWTATATDGSGDWQVSSGGGGGGSGTVTTVSVVTANGFAGSVATATTTPAITISTTLTGILKGNGTAMSVATAGTDYTTPSSTETFTNKTWNGAVIGSPYGGAGAINGILKANGSGTVSLAVSGTDYQAAGLSRLLTGTNTFSGAVEDIGTATNTYTYTANNLGAYSTPVGSLYRNTQAALTGAQQYSPATIKEARGFRTASGGASETVLFAEYDIPVQGVNSPAITRFWRTSIDGSSWFSAMNLNVNEINSTAILTVNGTGAFGPVTATTGTFSSSISSSTTISATNKISTNGLATGISSKSANYALTVNDKTILVDATSGNITITIPAASTLTGSEFTVEKIDATANTVTIDPNASETIEGATTVVLNQQRSSISFKGDGTNFRVEKEVSPEWVSSTVSTYTNYTTTATYQNVTSITLSAGDWDISAFFTYSANSATITAGSDALFVISTTTASASGATEGFNIAHVPQAALLGTSKFSDAITPYRVSPTTSTTYYLNSQATYTLGNPQCVGTLSAVRAR